MNREFKRHKHEKDDNEEEEEEEESNGDAVLLETTSTPPTKSGDDASLLDLLPDETLVVITQWLDGAKNLVNFQRTNRRLKRVLNDSILSTIVTERCPDLMMIRPPPHQPATTTVTATTTNSINRPLERLGLYEALQVSGLLQENRIGFDFASTTIDDDDGEASGIPQSQSRLGMIQKLLLQFSTSIHKIQIDAHCGRVAPASIAPRFSRVRGLVVADRLVEESLTEHQDHAEFWIRLVERRIESERVSVTAWGKRVAISASESSHPYADLAREGKGWVELYVQLLQGGAGAGDNDTALLELPTRPDYYDGHVVV